MSMRRTVWLMLLMLLSATLGLTGCSEPASGPDQQVRRTGDHILTSFDEADWERAQQFVERFKDKKGDYMMVIPPMFDSGHSVYDVWSDGLKVTVRIDNTRDAHSGTDETYSCYNMLTKEEKGIRKVLVGECVGYDKETTIGVFSYEVSQGTD